MDWSPFDIVGLDAFRSLRNAAPYRNDLRKEFTHGKPVAIMEVGCCTFRGAGDYGGSGWYVAMEPDGVTPKPHLVRDESEQVRYLDELITVFGDEGVDCLLVRLRRLRHSPPSVRTVRPAWGSWWSSGVRRAMAWATHTPSFAGLSFTQSSQTEPSCPDGLRVQSVLAVLEEPAGENSVYTSVVG
ncbi:hypothetical protein ACWCPX_41915 [Streptomyces olivaceoviridis]